MDFSLYPVVHRIHSIDRVTVAVSRNPTLGPKQSPNPADYYFSRAAPRKMTVRRWCETRFAECYPHLSVTVTNSAGDILPAGTELGDAETAAPPDAVYFSDISASLEFKTEKFAGEAAERLTAAGIGASVRNISFLFWKCFEVRIELGFVLISRQKRTQFEASLRSLAERFSGRLETFSVGDKQFLSEPFDIGRAGVTAVDLKAALRGL